MLEGQAIINYNKDLKTFNNQLFKIKFWIRPIVHFENNVWTFLNNEVFTDVIL